MEPKSPASSILRGWRRAALAVASLIIPAAPALAHEVTELTDQTAWSSWTFTPDIVIPTVVVALIYGIGMLRRRGIAAPLPGWRHAAFFGGLAAVFLALQSPVDPIAERLFWMHQIQHLLLRMAGPMLIALSWPQGVLSAGLRATVGTNLLKPIVSNRVVRGIFGVLTNPAVATILFIAALYVWQLPRYHNLAIVDDGVHYVMHVTMLLAGLVFWWLVFDRRSAPQGLGYGKRLMMLWLVTLSNILLGAYTVLKGTVLYGAYDIEGRLFGVGALADEQLGGIIIWIPGSMMCLIGILIVVHMWAGQETRIAERDAPSLAVADQRSGPIVAQQRTRNRALAFGFGAFVVTIFVSAILVGVLDNLWYHGGDGTGADDATAAHAMHGVPSANLQ